MEDASTDPRLVEFIAYKDPKRRVGSQSERPRLRISGNVVAVDGYQSYSVVDGSVAKDNLSRKYVLLFAYLHELVGIDVAGSFLDIGSSAGLLSLLAREAGFKSVTALDHDPEYIDLLGKVSAATGLQIETVTGNWRAAPDRYDVVAGISIIHWIFSMTASEGSFHQIFKFLASKTGSYLMLEWVAPEDRAIAKLQHVSRNAGLQKQAYTLKNFLTAANLYVGPVEAQIQITSTRTVYVFRKANKIEAHTSVIQFYPTCVIKHYIKKVVKGRPDVISREVKAFNLVAGQAGFPTLLSKIGLQLTMTNAGPAASQANLPADAEEQGQQIVETLRARGIKHNDIHPGNLCVKNGRLNLLDFGLVSFDGEEPAFLPDHVGVGHGVRQRGDPFDDGAMMQRSIELIRNGATGRGGRRAQDPDRARGRD